MFSFFFFFPFIFFSMFTLIRIASKLRARKLQGSNQGVSSTILSIDFFQLINKVAIISFALARTNSITIQLQFNLSSRTSISEIDKNSRMHQRPHTPTHTHTHKYILTLYKRKIFKKFWEREKRKTDCYQCAKQTSPISCNFLDGVMLQFPHRWRTSTPTTKVSN